VSYYWATRPLARRASLQYLERMQACHGVIGGAPGWRASLRHFLSFADTILDKLLGAGGHYPLERLRFAGREPLLALIERGRGALIVTAHVGCLELYETAIQTLPGFRLTVLVHTAHAQAFNRVLQRLRPGRGITLLQVSEVTAATAVLLSEKVAAGEWVAIAGDRVPLRGSAGNITRASFLGKEAPFPAGPYVLAALLKVPLYAMLCLREGSGHSVYFDALAERVELPRAHRAAAIAEYAARFAGQLETRLKQAPYEWFNFFPFWDQAHA
jgi:predicted LPLAT superfamily acyltransferase